MKSKLIRMSTATMMLTVLMFLWWPHPSTAAPMVGTVYTWIQTGTASWTTASNWTPQRTTPATTDILQFNAGGVVTVTNVPTEQIGQLLLSNNSTVNLQAGAANTLTIGGDTGSDLDVPAGSSLNINGTNALTIFLGAGATGSISGSLSCSAAASKLNANDANAMTFNAGSTFTQASGCTGNVFTSAGTANVIVFASGSTFISQAGSNPFGLSQPNSKVVFQSGSLFSHQQTNTPSFSGRTYANFELNAAGASISTTGGNPLSIDDLMVTDGTLHLGMTGVFNLRGNISVAAGKTLNFAPASTAAVTLTGSTAQTIGGTGTLVFSTTQNVVISNTNGITLQKDITLTALLTFISGDLSTGANVLTLGSSATTVGTAGDVVGTVRRNSPTGGPLTFNNANVQITLSGSTLASLDVFLTKSPPAGLTYAVQRRYTITPGSGTFSSATVRLSYKDSELDGTTEANLRLWRFNTTTSRWEGQGGTVDTTNNFVERIGVTAFSDWAISDSGAPTAVTLSSLTATDQSSVANKLIIATVTLVGLLSVAAAGLWMVRRARRS